MAPQHDRAVAVQVGARDDGGGPATRVAVRAGELAPRELDRSALGPTAVLLGVAGNFPQAFSP